ncbi:MAG: hypothetical protein ACRD3C_03255 [Vicinamibacterales bacterium]
MKRMKGPARFALCVRTGGSEDLEPRKVYQILSDRVASREGYVRVVDESGEDYLYPADCFVPVRLPVAIVRDLASADRVHGPAKTALQPTAGARRPRRVKLRAVRG